MLEPSTSNQPDSGCQSLGKGSGAGGVLSINSYKKATRGMLAVIEMFCILNCVNANILATILCFIVLQAVTFGVSWVKGIPDISALFLMVA